MLLTRRGLQVHPATDADRRTPEASALARPKRRGRGQYCATARGLLQQKCVNRPPNPRVPSTSSPGAITASRAAPEPNQLAFRRASGVANPVGSDTAFASVSGCTHYRERQDQCPVLFPQGIVGMQWRLGLHGNVVASPAPPRSRAHHLATGCIPGGQSG